MHPTTYVLGAAFAGQIVLGFMIKDVQPHWQVMPPAPTHRDLMATAFGDSEFLYRLLVMDLQNFGDTGGRTTPLKAYDMGLVVQWLQALDSLDLDAQHHVFLAARYFSQTQSREDIRPLVRYLMDHVRQNPTRSVQWLSDAIYLAQVRLKDPALAVEVADQLAEYDFPAMTPLAYQLPALVHEKAGDFAGAAGLMERALQRLAGRKAAPMETQFMEEYIEKMRARAKAPADPQ
jgi:hypothetical protein